MRWDRPAAFEDVQIGTIYQRFAARLRNAQNLAPPGPRETLEAMRRLLLLGALLAFPALAVASPITVPFAGTYFTAIRGKKPAALNGRWTIAIARGGRYGIYRAGRKVVTGSVRTKGSRAVFVDQSGPAVCPAAEAVGVYRWKRVGIGLTLTPLSEK